MHKIRDIFFENIFNIFVAYCESHGYVVMNDIMDFNFDEIKDLKGVGNSKLKRLIERYNDYFITQKGRKNVKSAVKNEFSSLIHPQNYKIKIETLFLFSFSKNSIKILRDAGVMTLGDLISHSASEIYHNGAPFYKKLLSSLNSFSYPIDEVIANLLTILKKDEHYDVLLKRAKDVTLQAIGEEGNVTRERIRQIEQMMLKKTRLILDIILIKIINKYNYKSCVNMNKVNKYLSSMEDRLVMNYTLKIVYKDYFLEFCNKFLINGETRDIVLDRLSGITSYYIKDVVNFNNKIADITDSLTKNNVPYIDIEDLVNYLLINGYSKKGDYIYKTGISYGILCTIIIKKYFKQGIKIHDEDELKKLRILFKESFNGMELPDNDRALGTRISCFLVLCGRGKYTIVENIKCSLSLLDEIYNYIMNHENSTLFFNDIFIKFKESLLQKSNIDNRYFLQGVLKLHFDRDFIFDRDSLTKKGQERKNIRVLINEYVKNAKRPVHREEIKEKFLGATDVVITNAQITNKEMLQWEYNYYIHAETFKISDSEKQEFRKVLLEIFKEFKGYASEQLLYERVIQNSLGFIKNSFIRNASNVFYLGAYLLGNEFLFKRPHIIEDKNKYSEISSRLVIEKFLFQNDRLKYSDYQNFVTQIKWSMGTTYSVFKELEKEIIRISEDEYIVRNKFKITKEEIQEIFETIEKLTQAKGYLPVTKVTDFTIFPKLKYEWNTYLLASIIDIYKSNDLICVSPLVEDRRYVKEIVVNKKLFVSSYEELIVYVINNENLNGSTLYHLETALSVKGLIGRYLPKELYNSKHILIKDEKFYAIL